MPSSRSIAAGFSILASSARLAADQPPRLGDVLGPLDEGRGDPVDACSSAKARSARSFSVSAASGSTTSGTLRPLLFEIVPPTSTLVSIRSAPDLDRRGRRACRRRPAAACRAATASKISRCGRLRAGRIAGLVLSRSKTKRLARLQHRLVALEPADPQLGPLQVGDDRRRPVELGFERADRRDPPRMILMAAMAHVDPEGVGARLGERADHRRACRWPGPASRGSAPCGCAGRTGSCVVSLVDMAWAIAAHDDRSTRLSGRTRAPRATPQPEIDGA